MLNDLRCLFERLLTQMLKLFKRAFTYLHQINHQIRAAFRQNNGKLPELRKQPLCSVAYLLGNGLKQDFSSPQGCVHLLVVRLFVDLFQFFVLHVWGQTEKDSDHPADHSAVELCNLTRKSTITRCSLLDRRYFVAFFQASGGKRGERVTRDCRGC